MAKTRFVVVIDGKPGAFGLWVPDMPGCTSMGETVDEALRIAQEHCACGQRMPSRMVNLFQRPKF